jgi:hypothetical protein
MVEGQRKKHVQGILTPLAGLSHIRTSDMHKADGKFHVILLWLETGATSGSEVMHEAHTLLEKAFIDDAFQGCKVTFSVPKRGTRYCQKTQTIHMGCD